MGQQFTSTESGDSRYTLAEMLEANPEDEELCEWLPRAEVGASLTLGGGAAGLVTVERVS